MLTFSKVLLLLLFLFHSSYQQLFPHIIWIYWNTGLQRLGYFQKMCLERIVHLHKDTDWQINFVEEKTIIKYLNKDNFQRFYKTLRNLRIMPQTKADLLRYYLLKQHGGVWLDVSIILKENLNWIDHLLNNPKVIHKNIFKNPEIFIHYQHKSLQQQKIHIKLQGYDYYPLFQIQNAMIGAVKQSPFINDLIEQFQSLLKQKNNRYYMMQQKFKFSYQYSEYFLSFRASTINQYKKYAQYLEAKLQHKQLTHLQDHFYKILILNRNAGMYHGSINQFKVQQFLLTKQGQYYGDYQTQMMKFSWRTKKFLTDLLSGNQKKMQQKQKIIDKQNYQFGKKFFSQQYKCFYRMKIYEESAINKYLFYNKDLKNKFFPNAQVIKQAQLPLICKIASLKSFRQIYWIIAQMTGYSIVILLLIQFAFIYPLYSLKISSSFQNDLRILKDKVFIKFIFIMSLYFQFCLIFSQYQMLKQDSPTAAFVGLVLIILSLMLFKALLNIVFKNEKVSFYIFLPLFIMLFIQYKILYKFTVWNYQGEIYNYQILTLMNKQKLKQFYFIVIKTCTLIVVFFMFNFFKWFFNLNQIQQKLLRSIKNNQQSDYAPITQKNESNQEFTQVYRLIKEGGNLAQDEEQEIHKQ